MNFLTTLTLSAVLAACATSPEAEKRDQPDQNMGYFVVQHLTPDTIYYRGFFITADGREPNDRQAILTPWQGMEGLGSLSPLGNGEEQLWWDMDRDCYFTNTYRKDGFLCIDNLK